MLKDFLFRRELRIDGKQVGPGNLIKPSALIWIFMETSEAHMNAMGWNHQRLAETGLAFLIIHNSTQLKRLPAFDEQLIVETAPIGCHGAQFYRGFRLLANDGEVGRMTQVSVLVDANTHQLMRPKSFYQLGIFPEAKVDTEWIVTPPHAGQFLLPWGERTIYYSDLDYNNHLNNTIYADIIMDFLPNEAENRHFTKLHIQYISEALLGDVLTLEGARLPDGTFYCQGSHARGICFKSLIR